MTNTNEIETTVPLLPCPFCGAEAEIERYGNRRQSTIYRCTSCSCSLETGEEWGFGRDWNTRSPTHAAGVSRIEHTALHELLGSELSGAYDCKRVWSAWGYGTMDEHDFKPVNDRLDEIVDAVLVLANPTE